MFFFVFNLRIAVYLSIRASLMRVLVTFACAIVYLYLSVGWGGVVCRICRSNLILFSRPVASFSNVWPVPFWQRIQIHGHFKWSNQVCVWVFFSVSLNRLWSLFYQPIFNDAPRYEQLFSTPHAAQSQLQDSDLHGYT